MAKLTEFKVEINDKLSDKLKKLDKHLREKVAAQATGRASKTIQRSIQSKIHRAARSYRVYTGNGQYMTRQSGELIDALILKRLPESERRGKYSVHKVVFSQKMNGGIGKIAHLIDGGVSVHDIPRKGGGVIKHPGHRAFPFFQEGVDAARDTAEAQMEMTVRQGIKNGWNSS